MPFLTLQHFNVTTVRFAVHERKHALLFKRSLETKFSTERITMPYSAYLKQCALVYHEEGLSPSAITEALATEGLAATWQGIAKFICRYMKTGSLEDWKPLVVADPPKYLLPLGLSLRRRCGPMMKPRQYNSAPSCARRTSHSLYNTQKSTLAWMDLSR